MKRIVFSIACLLFGYGVFGQGFTPPPNPQPQDNLVSIPPPPEASSLFKFIETPVSQYTGIANISIPIYDIKLRGLSLPIALNYHPSGFKVDEQASGVGFGWALQAGGVISSTVFGQPDFSTNGYARTPTITTDSGFLHIPETRELNPQFTWNGTQSIPNADYLLLKALAGNARVTVDKTAGQTVGSSNHTETPYDTQADLWYYSMFDQGGKFMYSRDGVPHPIPFNNYKIVRSDPFNVVAGYTITDTHGNIYVYDQSETIITTTESSASNPVFNSGSTSTTTNYSYYLSKIYTPLGDTVSITYTSTHYNYKNQPSSTRYRPQPGQFNGISGDVTSSVTSFTEVLGLQISQITTNRGHKVVFNYASTPRLDMPATIDPIRSVSVAGLPALQSIDIYENNQIKTFGLVQEYLNQVNYNTSSPNPDAVRLKLKQVTETGSGTYNLYYNNEYGTLPARFDFAQDHWGYFNGVGSVSFFPPDPANGFTDGSNRNPDALYCSMGVLNKMVYPTGGFTTYDYESNTYRGVTGATTDAVGGVGIYYSPDDAGTTQTTTFVIGNGTAPNSLKVKYDCNSTSNPQFNATLTGPGTSMTFNGKNINPGGDAITLPNAGTYTLSVFENGAYDNGNGFVQVFWDQQTTSPGTVANIAAGGLRIKTVKDYSSGSATVPSLIHNYTYDTLNTTSSSGHLYNQPLYTYLYDKITYHPSHDNCDKGDQDSFYLTQTSQSNLPLSSLNFGAIVYDEVQETQSDNSGNINGLTDNKYSVAADFKPYPAVYPFTPPTSYDFMRGNLLKSEIYKNVSGTLHLQKRISNTYNINYTPPDNTVNYSEIGADYTPATMPNEKHIFNLNVVMVQPEYWVYATACNTLYPAEFVVESYKFISNWQYLSQTTEEDYETGITNPVVTTTTYSYDNPAHAQLTKTKTTNSDGKQHFSLTTYPGDYVSGTAFITDLVSANNITMPIEKVSYEKLTDSSVNVLSGSVTEYLAGGRAQVSNVYAMETNKPIALSSYKFSNATSGALPNYSSLAAYSKDSHYKLRASIPNYDTNFNPVEVSVNNGTNTGYQWGYSDLKPIAVCKNAANNEFYTENFENNATIGVIGGAAHTGTKYFHGSFSVSWTRPNSRNYIITYWYKTGSGAWQYKQDTYSGFYNLSGGDSYDDICVYPADAQITTYTYAPLIGLTSTTDPSGKTTYYEYDVNLRLNNIRDQDGNILKSFCYNYAGQSIGCNIPISGPAAQTIYARVEIMNYTSVTNNDDPDDINTVLRGDVYIRFYTSSACTTRLTLNNNLDVIVSETENFFNGFGGSFPPSTSNTDFTVQSGVSEVYMGNMLINNTDTFPNTGFGTVTDSQNWSFVLTANGSLYTALATLN